MNPRAFLRFFWTGPGAILVIIFLGLGTCWLVINAQNKAKAEAEARQKQRELGQVNPKDSVDASQASKERILSDRKLAPGNRPAPEAVPIPNAPVAPNAAPIPQQARTLPVLVSFYSAQVTATPVPTPTPAPERPKAQEIWLPRGTLIPAALVNTVESSHLNTPVICEITRDIFQNGHLIIPAGTIATCFAQAGATRDRIEVAGRWSLTFADGKEFELQAIALDREADIANQQFGVEDGSAGLAGEIVESDHYANFKAMVALLITATTQAGTAVVSGAISHGVTGVQLPDTTPILQRYLEQLLNGSTGDARFVRVVAGKDLYLFPTTIIEPQKRSIGARRQEAEEAAKLDRSNSSSNPVDAAVQTERDILRAGQPTPEPTPPRLNYERK